MLLIKMNGKGFMSFTYQVALNGRRDTASETDKREVLSHYEMDNRQVR